MLITATVTGTSYCPVIAKCVNGTYASSGDLNIMAYWVAETCIVAGKILTNETSYMPSALNVTHITSKCTWVVGEYSVPEPNCALANVSDG